MSTVLLRSCRVVIACRCLGARAGRGAGRAPEGGGRGDGERPGRVGGGSRGGVAGFDAAGRLGGECDGGVAALGGGDGPVSAGWGKTCARGVGGGCVGSQFRVCGFTRLLWFLSGLLCSYTVYGRMGNIAK